MTIYAIQNQWGGDSAPWHDGGLLNIGNRADQNPVALAIQSGDGGRCFTGTMTYDGEGPIGVRATLITENCYQVQNQWGGNTAPWHDAGQFLLGARNGQNAVAFDLRSTDGGATLTGSMTYAGEGPIGVKGAVSPGTSFDATNQWGGDSAPWHPDGLWILGCRPDQAIAALDLVSADNGRTLTGTMTYSGEGPIGVRGTLTMANTYSVLNQWGGDSAPWHPGGTWVIGCRGTQGVVAVKASGTGAALQGSMTYAGEGPIGLDLTPATAPADARTPAPA